MKRALARFSLLLLFIPNLLPAPVVAETVAFDLRSAGAAGAALETEGQFTTRGMTVRATAQGGIVNANGSYLGVNAPSNADDPATIEAAFDERLSLSLSFTGFSVTLASIHFALVGGPGINPPDDSALISINDVPAIELHTSVDGFNGTSNVWTPVDPVTIASGDAFTFTADDEIALAGITVETSVVGSNNSNFNGDVRIDGQDFLIWQRGFQSGTMLSQGDANASNTVDGVDLAIWQSQYGDELLAVTSVPEPSGLGLLILFVLFLLSSTARDVARGPGFSIS